MVKQARLVSWAVHSRVSQPSPLQRDVCRGEVFGRLTVVSKLQEGKRLVKCCCGSYRIVPIGQLRAGRVKSCGCLKTESEDLTGQVFGRLSVVAPASRFLDAGRGQRRWLVRCVCGNEILVAAKSLKSGTTKSCGCLRSEISASVARSLPRLSDGKFYPAIRALRESGG